MSLVRSVAEIKQMYLERSDSLDASSYEVMDLCEEIERLRNALSRVRQGYQNILEFRRLLNGRYGALTREEIEEQIRYVDAVIAGSESA